MVVAPPAAPRVRAAAHARTGERRRPERTSLMTDEDRARLRRRWGCITLVVAGLLGCCWWSAPFPFIAEFQANQLDTVQGHLEVIAPAQSHPGAILAPGGHWMVVGWSRGTGRENFIWNLATDEHVPFTMNGNALFWLNADQFAVLNNDTYYLVQAEGARVQRMTQIVPRLAYPPPTGLPRLRQSLLAADHRYLLEGLLYSGTTLITIEQGHPFVYFDPKASQAQDLDRLFPDLPYTRPPDPCGLLPEPAYSPDGQFYAKTSYADPNSHIQIFTRAGQLVAEADKTGWNSGLMGWSYDSRGVYFSM